MPSPAVSEKRKCLPCFGTGRRIVLATLPRNPFAVNIMGNDPTINTPCPTCHGTGHSPETQKKE